MQFIPPGEARYKVLRIKALRSLIIADIVLNRYYRTDVIQTWVYVDQESQRVRVATVRKNLHKRHYKIRDSAKKTMLDNYSLVYPHLADLLTFPFSGLLTLVQV